MIYGLSIRLIHRHIFGAEAATQRSGALAMHAREAGAREVAPNSDGKKSHNWLSATL